MTHKYCHLCDRPVTAFPYAGRNRCRDCIKNSRDKTAYMALIDAKEYRDEEWLRNYWWGCPIFTSSTPGDWPANERWRPIGHLRGQYDVSDLGRVRSWWYNKKGIYFRRVVPVLLTPSRNSGNYFTVSLTDWHTGLSETAPIHVLVAEVFRGFRPSDRHVAAHRNGNRQDNRTANIDWITYKENSADSLRHGTMVIGEMSSAAKLTEVQVKEIRRLNSSGVSIYALADQFGVSVPAISAIRRRRTWKHVA